MAPWLPSWATSPSITCSSAPTSSGFELVQANVVLQRRVLEIARRRYREGQTNDLDLNQARSNLAQTEAQIPLLRSDLRAAEVRLCVLMGMPPAALEAQLGAAPIPAAPSHGGRGNSRRFAPPPPGRLPRRTSGRRTGRTNRHCRGRPLSHLQDQRRHGLLGGTASRSFSRPTPSTARSARGCNGIS